MSPQFLKDQWRLITLEGVVKFFDTTRGFGFIFITDEDDELVAEWFFHNQDLAGPPVQKGDLVEFVLGDARDGDKPLECQEIRKRL
jgi:cold shock CspA family protein